MRPANGSLAGALISARKIASSRPTCRAGVARARALILFL
jgi:hypothetical protein